MELVPLTVGISPGSNKDEIERTDVASRSRMHEKIHQNDIRGDPTSKGSHIQMELLVDFVSKPPYKQQESDKYLGHHSSYYSRPIKQNLDPRKERDHYDQSWNVHLGWVSCLLRNSRRIATR